MRFFKTIHLNARFFIVASGLVFWFCLSFFMPFLFPIGQLLLAVLIALTVSDFLWLYSRPVLLSASRRAASRLSLSDENKVEILLRNHSKSDWFYELVDELPEQLQVRDFSLKGYIKAENNKSLTYTIRPLKRGVYSFGNINVFVSSKLKLIQRKIVVDAEIEIPVYPSIIQMKKYELYTLSKIARVHGIKKMRRIGLSYEFEQIKPYVRGDDVRQINWKSTARNQQLMINQFEDEKSQSIYNIIDKSRIMLMPFNGLSLMDYAINASLVISNVSLKKHDKTGLITFSDKIGAVVKADKKHGQLQAVLDALYNQKERDLEANYELLYFGIRNMIKTRSLLFLYTNFESIYGLKRVLPILRKINQQHLLVVVFFENTELEERSRMNSKDLKEIYTQILAEQALNDKINIAQELNNLGIQTIYTKPEDLSINSINKYLEIKARGLI